MPSHWSEARRIAAEDDYLTQEQLLEASLGSDMLTYTKRDFLWEPGNWRGVEVAPPQNLGHSAILAIGHSDLPVTRADIRKIWHEVAPSEIWATNLIPAKRFSVRYNARALPLGLTNPTKESDNHPVFGDVNHLKLVVSEGQQSDDLSIYANFNPQSSPKHRLQAHRICRASAEVHVGLTDVSAAGRVSYLRNMRDSGIVVCPRGNGHDTHRFYEALYVGALPLVLGDSYCARLSTELNLPCVKIRSWRELRDSKKIIAEARRIRARGADLSAIRLSYWLRQLDPN